MRAIHVVVAVLLAGAAAGVMVEGIRADDARTPNAASDDYATAPNRPAPRPRAWVEGQGREITLKGEQICLKRTNTSGRQLMSCAIGFRGDDEKYYGLRDTDPYYRNTAGPGIRKQITGTLWPSSGIGEYVEHGTIEVREAIAIDDPKVLRGELACLPRARTARAGEGQCTTGLRSQAGYYWAFYTVSEEARGSLGSMRPGERVEVEGGIASSSEPAWFELWSNHPGLEGALELRRLSSTRLAE